MTCIGKDLAKMDLLTAFDDTAYALDKAIQCCDEIGPEAKDFRAGLLEKRAGIERQRLTLRGALEGDWRKYWPAPGVWPNKAI